MFLMKDTPRRLREGQQRDAKITGMTPPALTLQREVGGLAAQSSASDHALRILNGDAAFAALHQDNEANHRDHHRKNDDQLKHGPLPRNEPLL